MRDACQQALSVAFASALVVAANVAGGFSPGPFRRGGSEMFETTQLTRTEAVKCEICYRELARSEAQIVKARIYVAHVCGAQCYEEWEEEEMKERTREAGEP